MAVFGSTCFDASGALATGTRGTAGGLSVTRGAGSALISSSTLQSTSTSLCCLRNCCWAVAWGANATERRKTETRNADRAPIRRDKIRARRLAPRFRIV